MCFAPQQRALFEHLNFQKCSNNGVFWPFWPRNVRLTTALCTCSTSRLPKMLRECSVFSVFRSHNTLEKHSVSRLFYLFAHLHLLSSDAFSSQIFFLLPFSSLPLPTSAASSVHIVRSLTSKLPSVI